MGRQQAGGQRRCSAVLGSHALRCGVAAMSLTLAAAVSLSGRRAAPPSAAFAASPSLLLAGGRTQSLRLVTGPALRPRVFAAAAPPRAGRLRPLSMTAAKPKADTAAVEAQIAAQGEKVRAMKEAIKADANAHTKDELTAEVDKLKALKAQLAPPAEPKPAAKKPAAQKPAAADGKQGGKDKKKKPEKPESVYSKTVNLPETTFDQRANSQKREPELHKFWETEQIYEKLYKENPGTKFVLHDGPPYANGDLHIGHALNKILKDFINRYQIMQGRKVRFVPGWDCHGMPIELKVLQTMKAEEKKTMTPLSLRKKAAMFAKEAVDNQRESFKRYGVWADWSAPYLTLDPKYEAAQIEAFGAMVKGGHIYRGRKPVNWSPSSRTALAEAELEYPEGHVSTSMYASFEVVEPAEALKPYAKGLRVSVWTTTPWTIPANLAVAVNAKLDYAVVAHGDMKLVVAKDLVDSLASKLKDPEAKEAPKLEVLATFKGDEIEGTKYKHPLFDRISQVVLGGDYITTESGTGLVHTAPGHGAEDYLTGLKYGLALLSPVDDAGRFTEEAGPALVGKDVLSDGNEACVEMMRAAGALIKTEAYGHKYPYDWRTKKPTIFRATDQWFASVENFREDAMKAIDTVNWIPAVGKNRISPMIEGRSDWCISRQRSWGVPIPVFYHKETGKELLTEESINHVRDIVAKHGSDGWWELPIADLLPASYRDQADQWEIGKDTMDVWFDSGSSWNGVANKWGDGKALGYPADMYLEGSDQHRGWFQSSLLTSVAANGIAPFKTVMTHGFVLDEKGFKMSKSLGNVVDPKMVIDGGKDPKTQPAFGADVLRLWVASVDYTGDVRIGGNIMNQVSDACRKIRNTLRYILGNLNDFAPAEHTVKYEELTSIDKWMLGRLSEVRAEIKDAYDKFEFFRASQAITNFCITDLSNFYLDVAKDRLYISANDDARRRSCQTVLKEVLDVLLAAIAPILPHMAEDAWQNLPYQVGTTSVFQAGWPKSEPHPPHKSAAWDFVRSVRADVNACMEKARVDKVVGANLDAEVFIHAPDAEKKALLASLLHDGSMLVEPRPAGFNGVDDLRFLFLVSGVTLVDSAEEVVAVLLSV